MNQKISCIREKMQMLDIDGMIINNPLNIKYIIGIDAEGAILITDKENIFITDARYFEVASNTINIDDRISIYDVVGLTDEDYLSFFQNCNKVGFEENYITYANYNNMVRKYRIKETVETNHFIERQRMIKNEWEIANISKACAITDNCYEHILEFIKRGMTEKDIAIEIEKFFLENGAEGLAFDTIVASGENTSKPHSVPSNRQIRDGDIITIDFGAKYNGYCADMTRTFFVGNVSSEIKELYNFILSCQLRATEKIKDGADGKQITKNLEADFNSKNYTLIHALGHGVGLEVHELPYLSYRTSYTLKENMVVTNEPGVYIPGQFGIRIEDTIKVNKLEPDILTRSSKNITII